MAIVWNSIGLLVLVAVVCSALFWGTAGYAASSAAHQKTWIGTSVGALFGGFGLIGLGIAAGVSGKRRRAARKRATAADLDHAGAEERAAVEEQATAKDNVAVAKVATAEAAVKPATAKRPPRRKWYSNGSRILAVGLAVLASAFLVVSAVVPWLTIRTGVIPPFVLVPFGTGLDIIINVGAALILIAAVFFIWKPFRWAALLIAWISDWWLFVVLAGLVLQAGLASELSSFRLSFGGLMDDFGLASSTGVLGSPTDKTGLFVNIRGINLAEPLHHAGIDLGQSWLVLLLFVVLANVALFTALRHRPEP